MTAIGDSLTLATYQVESGCLTMVASVELPVLVRSPEFLHGMSGASVESLGQQEVSGELSILVRPFVSRANHPPGPALAGRLEGTRHGVRFTDSARRQPCAKSSVR